MDIFSSVTGILTWTGTCLTVGCGVGYWIHKNIVSERKSTSFDLPAKEEIADDWEPEPGHIEVLSCFVERSDWPKEELLGKLTSPAWERFEIEHWIEVLVDHKYLKYDLVNTKQNQYSGYVLQRAGRAHMAKRKKSQS